MVTGQEFLKTVKKSEKKKHLPSRAGRRAARKAASWLRGQARKKARNAANLERAAKNRELRAAGLPTPWERAEAIRYARRHTATSEPIR